VLALKSTIIPNNRAMADLGPSIDGFSATFPPPTPHLHPPGLVARLLRSVPFRPRGPAGGGGVGAPLRTEHPACALAPRSQRPCRAGCPQGSRAPRSFPHAHGSHHPCRRGLRPLKTGARSGPKWGFAQGMLPSKRWNPRRVATVQRWNLRRVRYRPKVGFAQCTLPSKGGIRAGYATARRRLKLGRGAGGRVPGCGRSHIGALHDLVRPGDSGPGPEG
jgi:hypothetical protein